MPQFKGKNAKKKTSSSITKRHFTVVMGNKEHGLYVSSSPSSAARKAVSKLCATDKKRKVKFSIREITQGSKKKTYGPYDGYIEKLKEPIELKGRVIKYKPVAKLSGKTGAKKGGMRGGMMQFHKEISVKTNEIAELIKKKLDESFKDKLVVSINIFILSSGYPEVKLYELSLDTSFWEAEYIELQQFGRLVDDKLKEILTETPNSFTIIKEWDSINA